MTAGVLATSVLALVVGYLLGSIPFGLLLTRMAGLGDIRDIGSGNIGATNVLRTGRKPLAAATLLADALKGTVAVLFGATLGPLPALVAGLGAFLGHTYPVWLRFKGGKGFATYLGVLAGLNWPVAIVCALMWLGVAALSRISSLSALTAGLVTPVVLFVIGETGMAVLFLILTVILWLRHVDNIRRLIAGSESRIGQGR